MLTNQVELELEIAVTAGNLLWSVCACVRLGY